MKLLFYKMRIALFCQINSRMSACGYGKEMRNIKVDTSIFQLRLYFAQCIPKIHKVPFSKMIQIYLVNVNLIFFYLEPDLAI